MFIPLRIMKVAGTVDDVLVGLKRTSSHRPKSVTAGNLTFRPSVGSTGVLPRVVKIFWCVIRARCRRAPNETFRFV